jgi:hypothetical protein
MRIPLSDIPVTASFKQIDQLVSDSIYFRVSRTITSTTQTGPDPISAPLHLLVKVDKKEGQRDERLCAMDFLAPFWGDVSPNPSLLMAISEAEAKKANILQHLSVHHDCAVYSVEWT